VPKNDSEKRPVSSYVQMSTVSLMSSLLTEDCSMFLPPQHKTLGRRLLEDVSVVRQDPLTIVSGATVWNDLSLDVAEKPAKNILRVIFLPHPVN